MQKWYGEGRMEGVVGKSKQKPNNETNGEKKIKEEVIKGWENNWEE